MPSSSLKFGFILHMTVEFIQFCFFLAKIGIFEDKNAPKIWPFFDMSLPFFAFPTVPDLGGIV